MVLRLKKIKNSPQMMSDILLYTHIYALLAYYFIQKKNWVSNFNIVKSDLAAYCSPVHCVCLVLSVVIYIYECV